MSPNPYRPRRRVLESPGLPVRCTFLVALCAAWLAACSSAAADAEQVKPSRLFELTKPATVRVEAHFKANISVPTPDLPPQKAQAATQRIAAKVQQGQIPREPAAVMKAVLQEILLNWPSYVVVSDPVRMVAGTITASGSGFLVTPDGYVVTNAHVVAPREEQLKQQLAVIALGKLVEEDMKDLAELWEGEVGGPPPEDIKKLLKNTAVAFYQRFMQVGKVTTTVYTAMGVTVPGVTITQKGIQSEVSLVGAPIPGKDVAILKAEGKNLPTLAIGDDSVLSTGDQIYVVGYPGAATFHPLLSQESQVEPTFTSGVISARKSMTGGWEILQTDAAVTHGNSGGPVIDSAGRVIGIATFGSIDPNTGQEIAGMNFVIPMSVVQQFLDRHNVQPAESIVSTLYAQALQERDRHYYKKAMKLLQEINAIAPGHPYVHEQISLSQKAITEGKDESWRRVLMCAIIGAAVVLVLGVGVVVLRRRGGRAAVLDSVTR